MAKTISDYKKAYAAENTAANTDSAAGNAANTSGKPANGMSISQYKKAWAAGEIKPAAETPATHFGPRLGLGTAIDFGRSAIAEAGAKRQIGEYNYNALQQALGRRDTMTQSGKSYEDWYKSESQRKTEAEDALKVLEEELKALEVQHRSEITSKSKNLSDPEAFAKELAGGVSSYSEELAALRAEIDIAKRDVTAAGLISELADSSRFDDIANTPAYMAAARAGQSAFEADSKANRESVKSNAPIIADNLNPGSIIAAEAQKRFEDYRTDFSYREPTEEWTQAERDRFYYLYQRDPQEAYQYGQKLNDRNKAESFVEKQGTLEDWSTKNIFTGALGTAAAVATMPLAWADLADTAMEYAARGTVTQRENISAFDAGNIMSAAIADSLNQSEGGLNRLIQAMGGSGTGDLYQIGLSTLQTLTYAPTLGTFGTGLAYFGAGAMSGFEDAYARGASVEQAMTYGLMAGAAEGISEALPIDHLLNIKASSSLKGLIKNALKQGMVEGSEEVASQIMTTMADAIVNGDKNKLEFTAQMYMREGMSPEEAEKQAVRDWVKETCLAFVTGAVSGSLSGGIQTVVQGQRQYQGDVQKLIDAAMQTAEGSSARDTAQSYAARLGQGENPSTASGPPPFNKGGKSGITNREALRLEEQIENSNREVSSQRQKESIRTEAMEKLLDAGIGEAEAKELADIIARRKTGEKLSRAELAKITGGKGSGAETAIKAEAQKMLEEKGFEAEKAEELADIIARQRTGQRVSLADSAYVRDNSEAAKVKKALKGQNISNYDVVAQIGKGIDARAHLSKAEKGLKAERAARSIVPREIKHQTISSNRPRVQTDEGEAELSGISWEDGEVKLNLKWADGSTAVVPQGEAELPDEVEALIKEAANYGESAPVMFGAIESGQDMAEFIPAYVAASEIFGRNTNLSREAAAQELERIGLGGVLSEGQFKIAFEEGRRRKDEAAAKLKEARAQKDGESGRPMTAPTRKAGGISYEGGVVNGVRYHAVDRSKLNERQRKQIAAIELLAEKTGINFVFYESQADSLGQFHGANGIYSNGTIYLDVNAGVNSKRSMKQIAIVRAAAHELTHYMQQYAQAQYQELKDFMLTHLVEMEGKSFKELVDEKLGRDTTGKLTYAGALDEIVADGCEMMLRRTKVMQAMAEEKPSLFETIKEWLSGWLEKLEAAFEGVEAKHREAKSMLAHMEQLQELWDKGLIKAVTEPVDSGEQRTQYSFVGTRTDGIEVYETSEEIKKLPWKERKRRFAEIMEEEYRGRRARFERNGHIYYALLEKEAVNKNIYGDSGSDKSGRDAKINVGADGNFFDLIENTSYFDSMPESGKKGKVHRDVMRWNYFIKTVQIDGKIFDVLANVRMKQENHYVYVIELFENKNIKPASPADFAKTQASLRVPTGSEFSILSSEAKSNTQNVDFEGQFSERDIIPDDRELLLEAASRKGASEELVAYRKKDKVLEKLERKLERLNNAAERDEAKIAETEKKIANAEAALDKMERSMKQEVDRLRGEWRDANAAEAARAMRQLREENQSLKSYLEYWKKQASLTPPESRTVQPEDIGRLAKALLEDQGSEADFNSVREQLQELGDYLVSNGYGEGIDYNELKAMARATAKEIIENAYEEDNTNEELRQSIRAYLRDTRLRISDELRGELGEDYNYFRKKNMGTLTLANEGRDIDSAYQEMAEVFGAGLFPQDITSHLEQLERMLEVLDELQPTYHQLYSRHEQREVTELLSNEIIERVMSGEVQEFRSKADQRYTDMKRRLDEATGELEQLKADQSQEIRTAVQRARAKANERAQRRQKMLNIDKMVKQLSRYLTENSATRKIPEPMKKSIGEFLLTIDMQYSPDSINGKEYIRRMQEVALKVYELQNEDRVNLRLDLGSGFADMLKEHIEKVQRLTEANEDYGGEMDWKVSQLDLESLTELEEILTTIRQSVKTSNELIANSRGEKLSVLAGATIKHLQSLGKLLSRSKAGNAVRNFIQWNNTTPYYFFKRLGSGGEAIFRELQEGWGKLAFNSKKVIDFAEKTYTPEEVKKAESTVISVKLHKRLTEADGTEELRSEERETVYMTKAQAMEIYALSRRTQALSHMLGAGIKISEFKAGRKQIQQADNYLLDIDDIINITNQLTEREKEIALAMQRYMNTEGSAWGNEVSMKRHGIRQFTEAAYWPIHTDRRDSEVTNPETENTSMYRLMNMGFTKNIIRDASNAVVIGSAFDTFSNHMADMAKYNALVLPMLDAMKFFSYSEITGGEKGKQYTTESVQKSAERAYGTEAKRYFIQFVKDMNGSQEGGRGEEWYSKTLANAKVAAVGANLRVAMLQPTSYVRALDVLDSRYLAQGMNLFNVKAGIEEALKYSGTAVWKSLGFYDTNINTGLRGMIKRDETAVDKLRDKSMWLAEKADQATWGALWNACKAQVQDQQHLSGEALLTATAELFDEVIYRTQVMDSTMTRSHNMRQKGVFAGLTMSFMSEPTLSYNMLLQAYMDFSAALRNTNNAGEAWQLVKQPVKRALITYTAAASVGAIVESLADALRDDDEYQSGEEKWLEAMFGKEGDWKNGNLLGNLMISNKLPIVKDFVSLVQGYKNERMDTEWMSNLVKVYEIWKETVELELGIIDEPTDITYNGNMTPWGKIYQTLKALSQISGIPVANLTRDILAVYNSTVARFTQRPITTYDSGPKNQIKYAVKDGYMSEDEATELLMEQGLAEDEDEAYWMIREWMDEGGDFSKYDALREALKAGDSTAFAQAQEELTAHGLRVKDVESKARSELKEWYQGDDEGKRAMPDKQKVIKYLQDFAGMSGDEAKALVEEWTCKVVTGIDYDEIKTAYIDGEITESRAVQLRADYGGYSREEAQQTMEQWKFEKKTGIAYSEMSEAYEEGEMSATELVESRAEIGKSKEYIEAMADYETYAAPAGMSKESFYSRWVAMKDMTKDVDEEGNTITSLQEKRWAFIDSLDLSPAQKDVLHLAFYDAKTLRKAPWNN